VEVLLNIKSDEVTVEEVTVADALAVVAEVVATGVEGSEAEQGDGTSVGPLPLEGWNGAQ